MAACGPIGPVSAVRAVAPLDAREVDGTFESYWQDSLRASTAAPGEHFSIFSCDLFSGKAAGDPESAVPSPPVATFGASPLAVAAVESVLEAATPVANKKAAWRPGSLDAVWAGQLTPGGATSSMATTPSAAGCYERRASPLSCSALSTPSSAGAAATCRRDSSVLQQLGLLKSAAGTSSSSRRSGASMGSYSATPQASPYGGSGVSMLSPARSGAARQNEEIWAGSALEMMRQPNFEDAWMDPQWHHGAGSEYHAMAGYGSYDSWMNYGMASHLEGGDYMGGVSSSAVPATDAGMLCWSQPVQRDVPAAVSSSNGCGLLSTAPLSTPPPSATPSPSAGNIGTVSWMPRPKAAGGSEAAAADEVSSLAAAVAECGVAEAQLAEEGAVSGAAEPAGSAAIDAASPPLKVSSASALLAASCESRTHLLNMPPGLS
eukprot:TRINITY_DN81433_c0_g1_i1.p1 TRINITY_DN81433_c0_g1~~TRINITY_DN81433_c0_g1_i1.p1  ORF type:complete len:433 (-),score=66.01 TRINITY_DN81433_c0_g1_i1:207-1505(-)